MSKKLDMLHGPMLPTLGRMTASNLLAVLSLLAYQLTDAFFISRLGSDALAAFGLTLAPTLMTISIALGLGSAMSVNLGRILGQKNIIEARQFIANGLVLAITFGIGTAVIGVLTIDPLFALLGAKATLLPYFESYMITWYLGVSMLIVQIMINQALRASGYTMAPAIVTATVAITNAILDPLLIFGIGPFPELGFYGAAVATVIGWVVALSLAIYLLLMHQPPAFPCRKTLKRHWQELLHIARPSTLSNLLNPMSGAILIGMLARIDTHAVAAFGVGMRIESLLLLVVTALSGTLTPFLAQNIGAGQLQRAFDALFTCLKMVLALQLGLYLLVWLQSDNIAAIFALEAKTQHYISSFLLWLPASYGLLAIVILYSVTLNSLHKPVSALILNMARLGLLLPAAWVGKQVAGAEGIFIAMTSANALMGSICWFLAKRRAVSLTLETNTAQANNN
ncbi:MATE family efflux transporter [Ferrimonas lipolytica]|uniref:MATE family efflux transporter n=1 Tax=Ferrimonas lipolytica TaxID=2724191 RepID=A0A6H1UJY1_9GAMM|nr:MATE family efflux transporter [Ferrimonas lipolytica]QIZ78623.1 MATE family efflux transporter [Ferrimonas lipolytica]